MSNVATKRPLEFAAPGGTTVSVAGFLHVRCNCGFPREIAVPYSTLETMFATCPGCRTQFYMGRISIDITRPNAVQIGLGVKAPEIMAPPAGLDVSKIS